MWNVKITYLYVYTKNKFRFLNRISIMEVVTGAQLPVSTQELIICPSEVKIRDDEFPMIERFSRYLFISISYVVRF